VQIIRKELKYEIAQTIYEIDEEYDVNRIVMNLHLKKILRLLIEEIIKKKFKSY
jgi:hypothetical protein